MISKRTGWLVVLFLGELFTATAMGFFEKEIEKAVVLALFVPLIISSGGNSGGFDPAVSSAPFVTTLVDVTGLMIYFTVAFLIMRGTLL
jgi:Mg/Co/Ni transporter MgtE